MNDVFIYTLARSPSAPSNPSSCIYSAKAIDLLLSLAGSVLKAANLPSSAVSGLTVATNPSSQDQTGDLAAAVSRCMPSAIPSSLTVSASSGGLTPLRLASLHAAASPSSLWIASAVDIQSRAGSAIQRTVADDPSTVFCSRIPHRGVLADYWAARIGADKRTLDQLSLESQSSRVNLAPTPIVTASGSIIATLDSVRQARSAQDIYNDANFIYSGYSQFGHAAMVKFLFDSAGDFKSVHTPSNTAIASDCAVMILIGGREAGIKFGLSPIAKIASFASDIGNSRSHHCGQLASAFSALECSSRLPRKLSAITVDDEHSVSPLIFAKELDVPAEKINQYCSVLGEGRPGAAAGLYTFANTVAALQQNNAASALISSCGSSTSGDAILIDMI